MSGLDYDLVRSVHLRDQAFAAHEEAVQRFEALAGMRGVDWSKQQPSRWLLRTVKRARRMPCRHQPREGLQVTVLPVHVGQLLCQQCATAAARALPQSPYAQRCDLCRHVRPLETLGFLLRATVVTGRCCLGCRPTIFGAAR